VAADLLVDTSVWIDVLRGALPASEASLARLIRARRVAVVGQVVAELIQGIRDLREQDAQLARMAGLAWLETDRRTWVLAGQLSARVRFSGRTVKLGDCVIAAAAMLNHCKLLTRDADFLRLPGLNVELI
jgi:predicted nucleic acid-binding protein